MSAHASHGRQSPPATRSSRTCGVPKLPRRALRLASAAQGADVLVSVFSAGETRAKASGFARLIYNTALRGFLADKAAADALLMESGLNWTIVYPVNLKDAPALPSQTVKALDEVSRVPGMPTLPMDNAAAGLLEVATDPATTGKRLLITTPTGWR